MLIILGCVCDLTAVITDMETTAPYRHPPPAE